MQQRVKLLGVNRRERLRLVEQPLGDRVHGEAHGGLGRPLRAAGLEHVEPAVLDGELGVLHVAVVIFERAEDLGEPCVDIGQPVLQRADVKRRPRAGDHVLALRVRQIVARRLRRPGDLVAGEGHTGA